MPLISIIIPVYNVELYIHKCLDSIVCQTNCNYELILVDDGSTDSSLSICKEYKSVYPDRIVLVEQNNKGVSVARNMALSKAKGEWVLFLDSDDWFSKDLFNRIVPLLQCGTDIIQFGLSKVTSKECYRRVPMGKSVYSSLDEYHATKSYIPGIAGYLIKRTVILENKIAFSEGIKFSEDHEFIFKCFLSSKSFYVLPESLYFYRDREGSAVYHMSLDKAYGCINVISNIERFIEEKNIEQTEFYKYWLNYSIKDIYKILATHKIMISSFLAIYRFAKSNTFIYKDSKICFFYKILYYKFYAKIINMYVQIKPLRKFWNYIKSFNK